LSLFDIIVVSIIALSLFFGFWRGFVKEILSILTWIAALLIARIYSEFLTPMFSGFVDDTSVRYVLAFAVLFILTMMLGTLLNHFMSKLITVTGLKFTDRLLGGVFGLCRGVIIGLLILFFAGPFYSGSIWWQSSSIVPYGIELIELSKVLITDSPTQS